jgi:hypothetical protein
MQLQGRGRVYHDLSGGAGAGVWWCTEGFDTVDLQEARALLDEPAC